MVFSDITHQCLQFQKTEHGGETETHPKLSYSQMLTSKHLKFQKQAEGTEGSLMSSLQMGSLQFELCSLLLAVCDLQRLHECTAV